MLKLSDPPALLLQHTPYSVDRRMLARSMHTFIILWDAKSRGSCSFFSALVLSVLFSPGTVWSKGQSEKRDGMDRTIIKGRHRRLTDWRRG